MDRAPARVGLPSAGVLSISARVDRCAKLCTAFFVQLFTLGNLPLFTLVQLFTLVLVSQLTHHPGPPEQGGGAAALPPKPKMLGGPELQPDYIVDREA